jgi:hypothetical protein
MLVTHGEILTWLYSKVWQSTLISSSLPFTPVLMFASCDASLFDWRHEKDGEICPTESRVRSKETLAGRKSNIIAEYVKKLSSSKVANPGEESVDYEKRANPSYINVVPVSLSNALNNWLAQTSCLNAIPASNNPVTSNFPKWSQVFPK